MSRGSWISGLSMHGKSHEVDAMTVYAAHHLVLQRRGSSRFETVVPHGNIKHLLRIIMRERVFVLARLALALFCLLPMKSFVDQLPQSRDHHIEPKLTSVHLIWTAQLWLTLDDSVVITVQDQMDG
jgi:hypothetical protein